MRKLFFLFAFIGSGLLFTGCFKDKAGDEEKIVLMTIYPETGYGASIMSDIITQPLLYSESDDTQKRMLVDVITEGFNFDYQRGYEFTLKVKKVKMHEPPQDVSSIKYVFIELLSKVKVITEDSEKDLELFVSSETVKFTPKFPSEFDVNQTPKIYNALHTKKTGTDTWMAIPQIEGFNFELGNEYVLNVKEITKANPYSIKYILLNILSKNHT